MFKLKLNLNRGGGERKPLKKSTIIILIIADILLIIGVVNVLRYLAETGQSSRVNEELVEEVVTYNTPEPTPEAEEELVEVTPELTDEGSLPISVNFDELLEQNSDCIGWLYSPDTPINLALMYSKQDLYYLYRTFDKKYNGYGTIFLDTACSSDFSDANSIIWGHDMQNGTMFGTLEEYHKQEYYDEHPVMYLLTPTVNYQLVIVAGFIHTSEHPMYALPNSREAVDLLIPEAISSSLFETGYEYNPEANYVTLSTCSDDYADARLAIVCEMVPID